MPLSARAARLLEREAQIGRSVGSHTPSIAHMLLARCPLHPSNDSTLTSPVRTPPGFVHCSPRGPRPAWARCGRISTQVINCVRMPRSACDGGTLAADLALSFPNQLISLAGAECLNSPGERAHLNRPARVPGIAWVGRSDHSADVHACSRQRTSRFWDVLGHRRSCSFRQLGRRSVAVLARGPPSTPGRRR
ncbi:hypothetical protein C8Q70DRAFT_351179 [Cubamyces menziesii]|nr:hypothetical protein C8Q70DRAFT_351179 [Cubamyces menziesii]